MQQFFEKLGTISPLIAGSIAVLMALLSSLGDFFIKTATIKEGSSIKVYIILGALVYGVSAIGWYFVFRKIPLATIGIIDGVLPLIMLVLMGYFFFGEKMSTVHSIGVVLGIISILCFKDLLG